MEAASKPLRMFISYNHKDENHLTELKKHLITLERKGILVVWYDRELLAGDRLNSEIVNNLLDADIVAFLVSVDFLNSWFCHEIELKKTLDRKDAVRIIPIIVRPCKWQDSKLSDYVAATKDGKAISKYNDSDDAWVEVVSSIEKIVNRHPKFTIEQETHNPPIQKNKPTLDPIFADKLDDTEVIFQHKRKEKINLEDIYVFPDLKNIKQEYDEIERTLSANEFTKISETPGKLLIFGSEQSGKTSLAKTLFKEYYEQGHLPLCCIGSEMKSATDVQKALSILINVQYSNLSYDDYLANEQQKVLIIDDYHTLKLNINYQRKLLENLIKITGKLILISNKSIKYDESKYIELSDYSQYEILPFGHLRSGELIEKWISIGKKETIEEKELHDESDYIINHVNSIARKNILPRKPIYLLTIIQLLDVSISADYSLTSYGYCYQSLIQATLKTKIKPSDFDLYLNYLTEMAYYIFSTKDEAIDDTQLAEFQSQYSTHYIIRSHDEVLSTFLTTGIMRKHDGKIYFGYRYIFYFYVAKYLSDHFVDKNCKKEIELLCENLHTEKNANILIFLVHHSKDQNIIDELLLHASVIFDNTKEANLKSEDTKYLLNYIATIPQLVIEQRNITEERRKNLKVKDVLDSSAEQLDDSNLRQENELDNKVLADINKSARIVEIIGQILRNRSGSLTKVQLKELCLSAYSSGLKFLNFYLTVTSKNQDDILQYIQKLFLKNSSFTDEQISKEARKIFLVLCYGTSYSVIKKIANSLGSDKLIPIFEEISNQDPESPAIQLIYIAILLEFTKTIPKKEVSNVYSKLSDNLVAQRLLQEIIIQHLYLNHVAYQDRQWISDKLKLPILTQRIIQGKNAHQM